MDPNENSQTTAPAADPMQAARAEDAKFWEDLDKEEDDSPALTAEPPQAQPPQPDHQDDEDEEGKGGDDTQPEQKPAPKPDKPWKKGEGQAVPLATLIEERKGRQELQRMLDDPDALERRLQELRSRGTGAPSAQPAGGADTEFRPFAKTVDDFGGDPAKWLEAMQKHNFDEGRRVATAEAQARTQAEQVAQSEARMESEFNARIEEAAKANPEVKEAVAWFVQQPFAAQLPAELRLAIGTDPQGPEKVFALLNDPQLAAQVFNAPGALGAFAFARIQVGGQAQASQPGQPAQKPAAPAVIPAVPRAPSGGRGTSGGSDPLESDDFDEFSKEFDGRMAKRKRRG